MRAVVAIIRTFRVFLNPFRFFGNMVQNNVTNTKHIHVFSNFADKLNHLIPSCFVPSDYKYYGIMY